MPDNDHLIRRFMLAWSDRDVDRIMAFFSDDAEYCNIPLGPAHRGKADIRAFIDGFIAAATHIDFQIKQQLSDGELVMNERVDVLHISGSEVNLPVMGVFRLREGKICEWRDYFDMAAFSAT